VNRGASGQVTNLLRRWSKGDLRAADRLFRLVYDELRTLAVRQLRGERSDHTLRPTALVREAFLRLASQREVIWRNRIQFFAVAAQAIRRVLVDHARARLAEKRAGSWQRVALEEEAAVEGPREPDLNSLDAALEELSAVDPDKVRQVELRFFGGLSVDEAAEVLGVSASTLAREWRMTRAWLYRRLAESEAA